MFAVTIDADRRVTGFVRMTYALFSKTYGRTPPDTVRFVDTPHFWIPDDMTDFLKNYQKFYFDDLDVLRRDYTL